MQGGVYSKIKVIDRQFLLPNGSLWIWPVTESDAGWFRCQAVNDYGIATSSEYFVIVSSNQCMCMCVILICDALFTD